MKIYEDIMKLVQMYPITSHLNFTQQINVTYKCYVVNMNRALVLI